jgi:hypothetical protein
MSLNVGLEKSYKQKAKKQKLMLAYNNSQTIIEVFFNPYLAYLEVVYKSYMRYDCGCSLIFLCPQG